MSYTAVCVVCILLCSLCDHYIITCAVVLVKSWSWPWNIKSSLGPNQKVLVLKNIEVLVLRPTVLVSKKCLIYITGCQCIFVLSFIFIFARSNVSKQSFNIVTTGLESMTDAFNHHGSAMLLLWWKYNCQWSQKSPSTLSQPDLKAWRMPLIIMALQCTSFCVFI